MWGTIFSHDKLLEDQHAPSRNGERNLKTVCGCPCDGGNENDHTGNPITLLNAFVNVQLPVLGGAKIAQLGNTTTTEHK